MSLMSPYFDWIPDLATFVWHPLLFLLVGTGLFLTFHLRGIQFVSFGRAFRLSFAKDQEEHKGDLSHFQALTTALAATIGIGNIAGVATALTLGGLGALVWLWMTTLIGMATKYSEAVLAIHYREEDPKGGMVGGPMLYLSKGLNWRSGAALFAFFGAIAALTTGGMVQSNSISTVLLYYMPIPLWVTGSILALLTAFVVLGGVRAIGKVTEVLVPAMALLYIGGSFVVLTYFYQAIPEALSVIFTSAFTGQAAVGGFAGATVMSALQMGVSRGVFSNESGLGTSSIAAAAARTDHPSTQALISMLSAFLSTIVCTFTGLAIAVTQVLGMVDTSGELITGSPLTALAFDQAFTGGGIVVLLGCILFGLSTIFGWAYYGERCLLYLWGEKTVIPFRIVFIVSIFLGVYFPVSLVWPLADLSNALMAFPNLIGLILLAPVVVSQTRFIKPPIESPEVSLSKE
jgi:alanine or glycine:cation symporter, AGCS family